MFKILSFILIIYFAIIVISSIDDSQSYSQTGFKRSHFFEENEKGKFSENKGCFNTCRFPFYINGQRYFITLKTLKKFNEN